MGLTIRYRPCLTRSSRQSRRSALLGLQTLPSTEAAINEAFKKAIRKVYPDRHFGSQAATEHSRMLLEARAILKKAPIIDGDLSSQQ